MDNKPATITFRPSVEVVKAIEKIRNANTDDYFVFTVSHAITKAILEYAKTLPESPKAEAPEKME